ncbi:hypothetical protein V501_01226 [Pseudogymnoascus sp. VKM F-4519 (FW-2642)]|nr:hypothetical protein V501_01226 [Pseudogymnoascus sp. VKM F-4519 (FW-2642)]
MATSSLPGLQAFVAQIGLDPLPTFATADALNNPIDIYHSYLAERLQTLVECDPDVVYHSIRLSKTIEDGDLDIVLPKLKLDGVKPKELAGELLKKFLPHPLFAAPFKDGVHIRVLFSTKNTPRLLLPYVNDRKAIYGNFPALGLQDQPESESKKVIVEFARPNIAREFTIDHLRSSILGAYVSNIHEAMGYSVVRVNYLGDWGKNLGLLGVGWQKHGSEEILNEQTDLFRYIHDLYAKMEEELQPEQDARKKARQDGQDTSVLESQGLFAERDATFKRMEDGEPVAIALWEKLRAVTIEYYIETYAKLNIKFDEYSGESRVSLDPEAIAQVESMLKENDIWEEKDGAWVIDFDKHGAKLGSAAIRDRNGSTTYLLRDIATVFDRLKTYEFDKMVYVVCEQDVHFRQVFKAVELMGRGDVANKLQHVTFTRANSPVAHPGSTQLLGDILDQCENHIRDAMTANPDEYQIEDRDAVAKAMGINSLILQQLSLKKGDSNNLDFNLLTSPTGETGTNLQLCYAKLCSEIAGIGPYPGPDEIPDLDYTSLSQPPYSDVLRLIARYPVATQFAFEKLDPGIILLYMFRVIDELSACLATDELERAEGEGESSSAGLKRLARVVMYENVRQVLENGLRLLGITPISQ